jgi:hypothetical protein
MTHARTVWIVLSAVACTPTARQVAPAHTARPAEAGVECSIPAKGLPEDVFCTGLYAKYGSTAVSSDVLPYTPGVVLWSDGAEKQRYLQLPPGTQIDTSDLDAWKFPVGTKAWKEFRVDGHLIETRLFWKRGASDWESGTYVWDESESTATLNTDKKPRILDSGYEIPTLKDCGKCHHGGSDHLLGIEAVALALPTAKGATLESLAGGGWLSHPPDLLQATLPEDETGKAGAALGVLHANCGMACHSARGLGDETQLLLRLRASEIWPSTGSSSARQTDAYHATVNQPPTTASVAQKFPDSVRITPGDHERSLLWQVAHLRGEYQMPPLVSHKVDEVGTQLVADWIDALMVPPDAGGAGDAAK